MWEQDRFICGWICGSLTYLTYPAVHPCASLVPCAVEQGAGQRSTSSCLSHPSRASPRPASPRGRATSAWTRCDAEAGAPSAAAYVPFERAVVNAAPPPADPAQSQGRRTPRVSGPPRQASGLLGAAPTHPHAPVASRGGSSFLNGLSGRFQSQKSPDSVSPRRHHRCRSVSFLCLISCWLLPLTTVYSYCFLAILCTACATWPPSCISSWWAWRRIATIPRATSPPPRTC